MTAAAVLAVTAAALPGGWPPAQLELGLASPPGGAAHVRHLHAGWRYQYLTGGVDTGHGWSTWNPDGEFASNYVRESRAAGRTPVLTYYQLLQSGAGGDGPGGGEAGKDLANLDDAGLMTAYYADLSLALRRAHDASAGRLVVLHVEPDLWGYVQQRVTRADDPSSLPAAVARSGDPRLGDLPDTVAGFAQAIVRLRDQLAPEVRLGFHMSTWGTRVDPVLQDPPDHEVDALATRSARFYANLHAPFDAIFSDPSDRDDGFKAKILRDGGKSRWTPGDYRRDRRWLSQVHRQTKLPIVMWQIPLGNRRLPDTWKRFRDTHVQTLLGSRRTLRAYRDAGVVALLFGGGADGTTSERTDGGLFARLAARYRRGRALRTGG
jgi:hypothetical protein